MVEEKTTYKENLTTHFNSKPEGFRFTCPLMDKVVFNIHFFKAICNFKLTTQTQQCP